VNCEEATELMSHRLVGFSTTGERRLQAHLERCPSCRAEAEASAAIWTELGALDDEIPRERMRARFHAALAVYEERRRASGLERLLERVWRRPALLAGSAAGLLLLATVLGVLIGRSAPASTDREIAELRAEVRTIGLALLDHPSASERLLGVEWAGRVEPDQRAIDALLQTLRYDPNVNVRLAAVEALDGWLDRPAVATGLTTALELEQAPLLQVTLAGILLDGGVEGSADAVRRILDRGDLDPGVRDYLSTALEEVGDAVPREPRA